MKAHFIILFTMILQSSIMQAQHDSLKAYLNTVPAKIPENNAEWQQYDFSLNWRNLDVLNDNQISCNRLKAVYRFHPGDSHVIWKEAILGNIRDFRQQDREGEKIHSLENFGYDLTDMQFLSGGFYRDVEADVRELAGWMVSDAAQMYGMGKLFFDSLEFGRPVYPEYFENLDLVFQNWYVFKSKSLKMLWSGITLINNEACAMVQFESLDNPVDIKHGGMNMKGRSLYWGIMHISLEDKEVEYFSMVEDVVLKMETSEQNGFQLINTQREVVFSKIR